MPQSSQCRWKQPELSVGSPCASLDLLGRYKCWLVKDKSPAHAVWKAVSKPIISLLDDQFEHLDAGDSDLTFEMFMVGRKPTSTVPTIIFSCESKSCRQKAMALVQKKSILAAYPGVYMAEYSRPPKPLAIQDDDSELLNLPAGVYLNGPLRVCGTAVLIYFGPKRLPRKATIGGIVCIDDKIYGVTAGHAFIQQKPTSPSEMEDTEFSFFQGDDPFDISDDEDESVEMTSQASMSSGSSQSPSTIDFDYNGPRRKSLTSSLSSGSTQNSARTRRSSTRPDPGIQSMPERYGSLFTFSNTDESLDWALVEIEIPILLQFPRPDEYTANNMKLDNKIIYPNSIASGMTDTEVVVCTGSSGVIQGRLSGVSAYKKTARQRGVQQLSKVTLSMGSFDNGDCGSWVCDLRTGAVYGHIVSGYTESGTAYLVPSDQIFQDIQRTLEKSVQLLTRSLAARNAALEIWGHIDTTDLPTSRSAVLGSKSSPLLIPVDSASELVHTGPSDVVGKPVLSLSKSSKAIPAFVEDVDDEGRVVLNTRIVASRDQSSRPARNMSTKRVDGSKTSDSGYSSARIASSYVQSSAGNSEKPTVSPPPVPARRVSVKRDSNVNVKEGTVLKQRKASRSGTQKTQRGERPSSSQASTIIANLSSLSGRDVPSNFGNAQPRPTSSFRPTMAQTGHFGLMNNTTPVMAQSIPLRPRVASIATRPMSYYGTGYGGSLPGMTPGIAPPYALAHALPIPPSYPPPLAYSYQQPAFYTGQYQGPPQAPIMGPAGAQVHNNFSPQPRELNARFASIPTTRAHEPYQNDSDDEYISAAELTSPQEVPVLPRSNSAMGIRDYGTDPPRLRRTGSQTEVDNRRYMPPPPPIGERRQQYDLSYNQLPQASRRSVSYDIDRRSGVRVEPAVTSSGRRRIQNYYVEQRPEGEGRFDQRLRPAVIFAQGDAEPSAALTVEALRRRRRHQAPGTQDSGSTRSSADTQSTRSSGQTISRSSSTSSQSSVTSRDDGSFKKFASARSRKENVDDEDFTIKISRGSRVTVGGTQIDCNDGGEIVINRLRSVLNKEEEEDRMNYDFPRTETLKKRFDRSNSAPEDGKSNLSMGSSASEETVKGKGKVRFDPPGVQTSAAASTTGDEGLNKESAKDKRERKRPVERAAEIAGRELGKSTKKRAKDLMRNSAWCAPCYDRGQEVWVVFGKACPVCGTPC